MTDAKSKPLEGVKVLDFTRVLAGPYCTMILAELGAEVIKVERPGRGDDSRGYPPFLDGKSAYFISLNRGKRSITLNLKKPEAVNIVRDLLPSFDIVAENFRPGAMERLGLGYEDLKAVNPRIIYVACSGYGHSGPQSQKPSYDMIVQAQGGIMSVTGYPGGEPVRIGSSIGDIGAGMFGSIGVMTALYQRERTGVGQKVDISMLDCQVAINENWVARYSVIGEVPRPIGSRSPSITPFQAYKTKDDWIVIAAGNDKIFAQLCTLLGIPEIIDDPMFVSNAARTEHHAQLRDRIEAVTKEKTTDEWVNLLEANQIPCTPINTIDKVVQHPQVKARNMVVQVEESSGSDIRISGNPVKMSELEDAPIRHRSPDVGEHTEEILSLYLGLRPEDIARLREQQVL